MIISEDRLEKALRMLATSDEPFAELKASMLRREYQMDLNRKKCFLVAEGNNEERKAQAEISPEVTERANLYYDTVAEYEKLKAKRATEELIVEVFRTLEASRRQGAL